MLVFAIIVYCHRGPNHIHNNIINSLEIFYIINKMNIALTFRF